MGRVVSLLAAAALIAATPAYAAIGTIKRVAGTAAVERGKVKRPAAAGTRLEVGDTLHTGRDGRIAATFVDDSRFSVGPGSRVVLTGFEFDDATHKGKSNTRVEKGTLAIVSGQIAHENPKGMTVQTPTSILGVRGTRFVVRVK